MYVRERVGHAAMSRLRFCESRASAESNAIVDAIVTYYICMYVYIYMYTGLGGWLLKTDLSD